MALLAVLLGALAQVGPSSCADVRGAVEAERCYRRALDDLEGRRVELARRYRRDPRAKAQVLEDARSSLLASIDGELFPAWYGTPWDFYGTSESPRSGTIACGYFVTTVLRDAGFRLDRVKLAQQASERIVTTLVPPRRVLRFRDRPVSEVLASVRSQLGEGLYVVGLDYHVAFLRVGAERDELCHSSVFEPVAVVCEPAATAEGLASRYHVVGKLLTDAMLDAWLRRTPLR